MNKETDALDPHRHRRMNKRERNRIYKKALKALDESVRLGEWRGLCECIWNASEQKMQLFDMPEINAMRIRRLHHIGYLWPLNSDGHRKRRSILLKCIKQTQPIGRMEVLKG